VYVEEELRMVGGRLLDYGSATLVGLPKQLIDRLQSVQNAAARLISRARRYDPRAATVEEPTLASGS